jgi:hypothetical protein
MDRHERMDREGGGFAAPLLVGEPGGKAPSQAPARESFWARLSRAFVMARIRQAELEVASYLERDEELLAAQRIFLGLGAQPRPATGQGLGGGASPRR